MSIYFLTCNSKLGNEEQEIVHWLSKKQLIDAFQISGCLLKHFSPVLDLIERTLFALQAQGCQIFGCYILSIGNLRR